MDPAASAPLMVRRSQGAQGVLRGASLGVPRPALDLLQRSPSPTPSNLFGSQNLPAATPWPNSARAVATAQTSNIGSSLYSLGSSSTSPRASTRNLRSSQHASESALAPASVLIAGGANTRPSTPMKTLRAPQEDTFSTISSVMTPLLAGVERRIISNMDKCFQEQQQALLQLVSSQQHQQAALEAQEHALVEMSTAHEDRQFSLQQQKEEIFTCVHSCIERELHKKVNKNNRGLSDMSEVSHGAKTAHQDELALLLGEPVNEVNNFHALSTPLLSEEDDAAAQDGEGDGMELTKSRSQGGTGWRMSALFPRTEPIKLSVELALHKSRYRVEDYYHESGMCQRIARNEVFQHFILFVVGINTIWIAVETDYNKACVLSKAPLVFQIVDNIFCTVFAIEIVVRFCSFRNKLDASRDRWFVLDSFLVAMLIWETWIIVAIDKAFGFACAGGDSTGNSQIFRVLRLIRMFRVARTSRLVKCSPELLLLARGMMAGMRAVMAVLMFVLLLVYVFAVVFTVTFSESDLEPGLFDSVLRSMNTLVLQVICGPDVVLMKSLLALNAMYYAMFLSFVALSNLTLMNMLIGVLCEVLSTTSTEAKEENFTREVDLQIAKLAERLDIDQSGGISKHEFEAIISDPGLAACLDELGVDIVGVANFAKFLFDQCDELTYADFAQMVGHFRGFKEATVKDIMDLRRYLTMEILNLECRMDKALEVFTDT